MKIKSNLNKIMVTILLILVILTGISCKEEVPTSPGDESQTAPVSQITTVNLPKTGQTTSYATGDDGNFRNGVDWPNPRFTDNGNGTITDNLTGLMWEKVPSLNEYNWNNGFSRIAEINNNALGGHTNWRMPNINEFQSLINYAFSNTKSWLESQGFNNIKVSNYWSSTGCGHLNTFAWIWTINMGNNFIDFTSREKNFYVIAVRSSGKKGIIDLPKTGKTTSGINGDDGDLKIGVSWPNPRFINNGNGTIKDNLTGLTWEAIPSEDKLTWNNAFDRIKNLNNNVFAGYTNWRMPNINELKSIVKYGLELMEEQSPAGWLNKQGFYFSNVVSSWYWSSTTCEGDTDRAYIVGMFFGGVQNVTKSGDYYIIAVRSGN